MAKMPPRPEARIFFVDTHFQKMARCAGGVSREQAIERAQAKIDELQPEFGNWLEEELQNLRRIITQAERDPGNDILLEKALRSCCQLSDVGTTMGFELITFVAGNLSEILDAVKTGATFDKDMIDCHIDALFLARQESYRQLSPEQLPEMTSGLRRVVERASGIPARATK